ncbi:hypothetical protein BDP27DRAFT_1227386 [Rhodocollybia butyracea]|uniref:DUF6534 domain-containing protein n=1 Tax=Rhodocollybia butyracea TaxID=206335 RepID=A0A9P5PND7_9AGAR|nr:hypothetical protein BDP27DRAFT_1227386 [Rhodocollybia butyracea]
MSSASSLNPTIGAMLIGVLFATFFQGVLTVQAYIYYESFPKDKRSIKLLVCNFNLAEPLLEFITKSKKTNFADLLHLILIADSAYHYMVTKWGDPMALGYSTEELDLHMVMVGLATILCQGFFLQRIWIFSNKNIIMTGLLLAGCVATLGLDMSLSIQLSSIPTITAFSNSKFMPEVIATFAIGAGVDLLMALILVFYLQQRRSSFQRSENFTNFILSRVIQYTVATGLVTSLIAVNSDNVQAMHFSLGRMYTNALLATYVILSVCIFLCQLNKISPPGSTLGVLFLGSLISLWCPRVLEPMVLLLVVIHFNLVK